MKTPLKVSPTPTHNPGAPPTRCSPKCPNQINLATFSTSESEEEQGDEQQLDPEMRQYMSEWIQNFERDPNMLNSLTSNAVQNLNYGFGDGAKK